MRARIIDRAVRILIGGMRILHRPQYIQRRSARMMAEELKRRRSELIKKLDAAIELILEVSDVGKKE